MTPAEARDAHYRALADPVRRRILRLLEDSPGPCDVESLARRVGLHPNTVRGHLDLLAAARMVRRDTERRSAPGRPRVVYQAESRMRDAGTEAYRLLAELLARTLCDSVDDPGGAAEAVGRSWGVSRLLDLADEEVPPEAARRHLTDLLDEIGFEPHARREGPGLIIELNDCPFRELAREHADVVCALHLGLMKGAADALGSVEIGELQAFAGPSLCRTVVVDSAPVRRDDDS